MVYNSTQNEKIKNLKKLQSKKYRDLENKFLIEGEHLILEAYKNNLLEELFLEENDFYQLNVKTNFLSKNVLKYLSELENPTMIGLCKKPQNNTIGNKIIGLDNIQDPGNLGTIIRSAVAFNIDTIILNDNSVDIYNSKVLRATQGLIFNINIIRTNLKEALSLLENHVIYGTDVNNGEDVRKINIPDKFVLIMGNEGNGLSDEIKNICQKNIYIKTNNNCESLNVAVATSIILYEMDR